VLPNEIEGPISNVYYECHWILMWMSLNMSTAFGNIDIFPILILPTHKHKRPFHFL
jgi:hypothetical protein